MRVNNTGDEPGAWAGAIFKQLRVWQVAQVVYVPDAGHANLIEACIEDNEINRRKIYFQRQHCNHFWFSGRNE